MIGFQYRCSPFALSVVLFCAATGVAAAAPDHCIVGESVFGCRSEAEVAHITAYRGDADALRRMIAEDFSSGVCQMFKVGEPVYTTSVTNHGDRTAVRRPGDTESYWIPASWSRPAAECSAYTTSRSLREKLGLAAASQQSAPDPDPQEALSRKPSASPQSAVPGCTVKPAMTDAEIALCRSPTR
jgi:hypothetical protein